MRASAIYYIFLLINDLCTNTQRMFTRLRTPGNSNKATVRKFIGGGTLDSGLYRTKSCKGHPPITVEHRRTVTVSGELEGILLEIPSTMLSSSA